MQFVGDAVMACFGAPVPLDGDADHAMCAAHAMLERQRPLNERWLAQSKAPFGLGIGVSTGAVARRCSDPRSGSSTRSWATP